MILNILQGAWKWVAGAALAVGAFLLVMARERSIGRAQERAAQDRRTAEKQKEIDDADARGPRTADDVADRLRNGRF